MHHSSATPFERLAACHDKLRAAALADIKDWLPDAVPPTVGLGTLGAALVAAEPDIDDETLDRIASCVGEFLTASGTNADAVATGFLEAICNLSADCPASVERVVRHLGGRAVSFIRGWDEFTGVETPGAQRVR